MTYMQIQKLFDMYYELCLMPNYITENKQNIIDDIWNMIEKFLKKTFNQEELELFNSYETVEKEIIIHKIFKKLHSRMVKYENLYTDINNISPKELLEKHLWERRN